MFCSSPKISLKISLNISPAIWRHLRYGLLLSGLLYACEPVKSNRSKVQVIEKKLTAQAGKANFLVLTNVGSGTSGGVSLKRQDADAWDEEKSAIPILGSRQFGQGPKNLQGEPLILHSRLPETPLLKREKRVPGLSPMVAPPSALKTYVEGKTETFNVSTGFDSQKKEIFSDKTFTLYKKVTDNNYNIHYWKHGVVQNLDAVISAFSNTSTNKDILGTSIAMFGEPWGLHEFPAQLILGTTKDIHLLFYDIHGDAKASGGKVLGYFYSRDNFLKTSNSGSNQKLVLALDSPSLKDAEYMQDIIIHEFQHMIHFYQKTILRATVKKSETWLNEMLSEVAVDLVRHKLSQKSVILPRRLAYYLKSPWKDSLTGWQSSVDDYYSVAAFGSYLLRRSSSPSSLKSGDLARKILQNQYTDAQAITSAISQEGGGVSWENLIAAWGVQTLASYPATSDLSAIDLWNIDGSNSGIPMFHLIPDSVRTNVRTMRPYMLYFDQSGLIKGIVSKDRILYFNTIQFPKPGGHVYVYLGKPKRNTDVHLSVSTSSSIRYALVPLP